MKGNGLLTLKGNGMRGYYGIEILRLLTALSVLLYHYRLFFGPYNPYSAYNFTEEKVNYLFKLLQSVNPN